MPIRLLAALGFVAALLLPACGISRQDRPVVLGIFPAHGTTLDGPLQEIRIAYDEPVAVLNPNDLQVAYGTTLLPVVVQQRPSDPTAVYLVATSVDPFPEGGSLIVRIGEGAVVNAADHYAADEATAAFTVGSERSVPVGHPGFVTLLDATTFGLAESKATPAGRDAVGLVSTVRGTTRRVWAQLDNGAGGGDALAWFEPGTAAPMTVVSLTAGGALSASAPALLVTSDGLTLFAAFRDAGTGGVRLARIDTVTGLETGSLLLASIPAGAGTEPAGMAVTGDFAMLIVSAHDGATGSLAFVDPQAFVELDRDSGMGGIQGLALPAGAGPIEVRANTVYNADPGGSALTAVDARTLAMTAFAGDLPGVTVGFARTRSGQELFQALAAFPGTDALGVRFETSGLAPLNALPISDDVGGVPAGVTDSIGIAPYAGTNRFVLLMDSAAGVVAALVRTDANGTAQVDLDGATAGTQVVNVDALVPGATVVGRTLGTFAP